jgi:hypothetical protein
MDLIERYLQAVKKHLPWKRQDDIIAELRANLVSQFEDKETELGRPLTIGEVEAWLKQIGPPKQMAAPFRPQRYLIGPALFPVFCMVMAIVLIWVTIFHVMGSVMQMALGTPTWSVVLAAVTSLPDVLVVNAAWVTLIFAVIEFAKQAPATRKTPAATSVDWSPSSLPPVEKDYGGGQKPRSYAGLIVEVVFGSLFLVWLLLLPRHPYLLFGPGVAFPNSLRPYVSPFRLAPIWSQVYWWVLALTVLNLSWSGSDLWRGTWRRPRPLRRIAQSALGLIPLGLLLAAADRSWVKLKNPVLDGARYHATLDSINHALFVFIVILSATSAMKLVWEIGRAYLATLRKRAAAMR